MAMVVSIICNANVFLQNSLNIPSFVQVFLTNIRKFDPGQPDCWHNMCIELFAGRSAADLLNIWNLCGAGFCGI